MNKEEEKEVYCNQCGFVGDEEEKEYPLGCGRNKPKLCY